ncbi:hypothetical protein OB905_10325 [Halobacteria archaeon AArc-dxtr1]|nr:hypothetical protein [Halobacteria archaeon AArc-dxtr1]
MTPNPANMSPTSITPSLSRRRVLATSAGLATAALAGCSTVVDFLAGLVLDDVNVINGADEPVAGTIEVTDPAGERVLDETFDLEAGDDDGDEDAQAIYDEVFTDAGEYTVHVELDDGDSIDGEEGTEETIDVDDPDDEHILVFLGSDEVEEAILVTTIEELSDLEEYADDF